MRALPAVPLLLSAALLAGCGGGSSKAASSGVGTTPSAAAATAAPAASAPSAETVEATETPAPSPSAAKLTKPQAVAIAKAAQLNKADLPGFAEDRKAAGPSDDTTKDESDKELEACLGGDATSNALADYTSSDFSEGQPPSSIQISSETSVVATAGEGRKDFALLTAPTVASCLDKLFRKQFSKQDTGGAKFSGKLSRVPTTKPEGSDGAGRFVYSGTISASGLSIPFSIGILAVLVDRAEITLLDTTFGKMTLSGAERDRLTALLVSRARKAQGS